MKLFSYFKDNKIEVKEIHKGIYQIDSFDFPVQIVVTKELDEENHTWVSAIARDLSEKQLRNIIIKAKTFQTKAEKQYVSSILSIVSRLNMEELKKVKGDKAMEDVLYEMLKPRIDNEIQQGILKNLIELVKKNLLTLEIASQEANMSQEEFKKLLAQSK